MTAPIKRPKITSLPMFYVSFFGSGLLPYMPGTWGTIATIPFLAFFQHFNIPHFFLAVPFTLMTAASGMVIDNIEKEYGLHDPGWIVIDEVLGLMLAWMIIAPTTLPELLILAALFRFFDIFKIWPANIIDKNMKTGFGTILDDLVSGVYAALTLWIFTFLYRTFS